jgi:putative NADH-flavin reductase
MTDSRIPVAVLGATGSVGQRFVQLLEGHPWFRLHEVIASEKSEGKTYAEAGNWNLSMEVESTNGVRDWFLKVNTVRSTPAFTTPGTGIFNSAPRVVELREGINHILTELSSIYGGTYLTLRKFIFTRV